jgi:hypothetical protein
VNASETALAKAEKIRDSARRYILSHAYYDERDRVDIDVTQGFGGSYFVWAHVDRVLISAIEIHGNGVVRLIHSLPHEIERGFRVKGIAY